MARTLKAFITAVKATVKAEGNLRDKYQEYGLEAMTLLQEHGDTSKLAALVNIMSTQSPYRKLMFKWVRTFAPVRTEVDDTVKLDDGTKGFKFKVKSGASWADDTDINGATEMPFWMIDGAPGKIDFDPYKMLQQMLDRYEKVESGEAERVKSYHPISKEDRQTLTRILGHKTDAVVLTTTEETQPETLEELTS